MTARPAHAPNIALLGDVTCKTGVAHGGTGIGLLRLANALSDRGARVTIVTASTNRLSGFGIQANPGVPITAIGQGNRFTQVARLTRRLLVTGADVLVARDSRAITLGMAAVRLLRGRVRLVCAVHNDRVVRPEQHRGSERRKDARFAQMAKVADAVIAVSPGIAEAVRERNPALSDRLHVIPNPAYAPGPVDDARRNPVPRPCADQFHLVGMGRLSPEKDHITLIDAFADLRNRKGLPLTLTLLGEGPQRPYIEARAREKGVADALYLPGFSQAPLRHLADADVFVLSSRREAFGYVLVEALSMGVPVVSTDCPYGPRYILDDGRFGELVPVGDAQAVAEAVAAILEGPPIERSQLEARARDFESGAVADRYLEVIAQSIGARGDR